MEPVQPGAAAQQTPDPSTVCDEPSTAYHLLHQAVQRWVYDQGWRELRDAQERAAAPILAGDRDVIIAAGTAAGKTEAALLPICSALLRARETIGRLPGVSVLYVSPLKALINDQYDRIRQLGERIDLPVHRWHGDVASSAKARLMRLPEGLLLITPESLEALFVNRGQQLGPLLGGLRYAVVDELHCFLGTERGAQLRSLLHRVDVVARRRVPRVALSATLGDFAAAADYLRPGFGDRVTVIASTDDAAELRLQVRGYVAYRLGHGLLRGGEPESRPAGTTPGTGENLEVHHLAGIADHLFRTLCRNDHLVFVNSRAAVETYADLLARRAGEARVRTEFLAHHGSLAKDIREHVEERLKDPATPVTAICTSTLEMGIDVGSVDSVAQIGSPMSVTSLRQRLGRSGRREGHPAVLRIYASETELTELTPPPDALRDELFEIVAMVELLLTGWYERPDVTGLHLSTMIQQILSVLAQHGGATPAQVYQLLCAEEGPFAAVDLPTFRTLLRDLGRCDLIRQDAAGTLLPGGEGDRLLGHYSFYAAFRTSADYRLVAAGKTLGSLPVDRPMTPGTLLIFNGRRWKVLGVDVTRRVVELEPASAGQPPAFPGSGGEVAGAVRQRMRQLYQAAEIPRYLDPTACDLFCEGQEAFRDLGLVESPLLAWQQGTMVFPWCGDRAMNTLLVVLTGRGLEVGQDGMCLVVRNAGPEEVAALLADLAAESPPDPVDLAATVRVRTRDKHDRYLGDELLNRAYAARALDVHGAWQALTDLVTPSG